MPFAFDATPPGLTLEQIRTHRGLHPVIVTGAGLALAIMIPAIPGIAHAGAGPGALQYPLSMI